MAFSGNLEHLPIADVLQLLETTKKSGTLLVKDDGCLYKFGLENGYIVSVTHPDTGWSLGKVISLKKIVDEKEFINICNECANNHQTVSSYLCEHKIVPVNSLQSILTNLVELTVVDILTWNSGSFELDVDYIEISDEFKYLVGILSRQIYISTQNTLMEAMRIFDEWRRDGILTGRLFTHKITSATTNPDSNITITEDILGLDNVDKLERKIPNVFTGIKEFDFFETHYKKIKNIFPNFSTDEQKQLAGFLADLDRSRTTRKKLNFAITLLTDDDFTIHSITTICKNLGVFAFSTDTEENLDVIIKQSLTKELVPIVIIDKNFKLQKTYPFAKIIRLVAMESFSAFMESFEKSSFAVFPKPEMSVCNNVIVFFKTLHKFLENLNVDGELLLNNLNRVIKKIRTLGKVPDIPTVLTDFLEQHFMRIITFQLQKDSINIERIKGFRPNFDKASFYNDSTIANCILTGNFYYDIYTDELEKTFYSSNPKPSSRYVCVIPLGGLNKTLYIIYADEPLNDLNPQYIELLQNYANMAIDAVLYRKLFEKNRKTE